MATIKSYTDIEQSKKLAEFLSLESANMYYQYVLPKLGKIKHNPEIGNPVNALKWYNKGYTLGGKEPITLNEYCVPCWSLAALLSVLPVTARLLKDGNISNTDDIKYNCESSMINIHKWFDNPVDACVGMIEKLHELKML